MSENEIAVALKVYRQQNPKARATKHYRTRGGASRRAYYCTFCECYLDAESANYPQTKHAAEAIAQHVDKCPAIKTLLDGEAQQ